MYQKITIKEKKLIEKLNEVNNGARKLKMMTLTNELYNLFNAIIMRYAYKTMTLN